MTARTALPVLAAFLLATGADRPDGDWYRALRSAEREEYHGRVEQAEAYFLEALARAESFGPTDVRLGRTLEELATLYHTNGRPGEAEPLYERALGIWERTLGSSQPRVATTLHNLGAVKLALGRADEAEPLLLRALALWEKTLGPDAVEVALALESYATLLRRTGRHDEAVPFEERARAIRDAGERDVRSPRRAAEP